MRYAGRDLPIVSAGPVDKDPSATTWMVGENGLFCGSPHSGWRRLGAGTYPTNAVVVGTAGNLAASEGGFWSVSTAGRWVQQHDETLTSLLAVAAVPVGLGMVVGGAYGIATASADALGSPRWRSLSDSLPVNARYTNALLVDPRDPLRWVVGTEAGVLVFEHASTPSRAAANPPTPAHAAPAVPTPATAAPPPTPATPAAARSATPAAHAASVPPDAGCWHYTSLTGRPVRGLCWALGRFWAGTDGAGLWSSPDALTWQPAGRGLATAVVYAVAGAGDRLLLGLEGGLAVGDGSGEWLPCGPRLRVRSVAAVAGCWLAAANPGGLWYSTDGGRRWGQTGRFVAPRVVVPAATAADESGAESETALWESLL